jgi:2-methylisocitrate lyase-like PEP mutase family enzyme
VIGLFAPRDANKAVSERLDVPLLINMFAGGRTPVLSADEVSALGYQLMIVASDLQRASLHAMREAAGVLRRTGSTASLAERMTSFTERDNLVDLAEFSRVEDAISSSSKARADEHTHESRKSGS